jgi:hypothetical protein
MRLALPLALAVIATGTAHAEQAGPAEPGPGQPIALAINAPLAWKWSVAASAWVGWDAHHAIRANFARYRGPLWRIIPAIVESDGDDGEEGTVAPDFGATTDLGLGWVYYPRRVLDGATVEVGALVRLARLRDRIDDHNMAYEGRDTNLYSGRILVGWTWRLSDWWFLATGIGASLGYERGKQKAFAGYDTSGGTFTELSTTSRVSRPDVSVEAYLRIGMAFGQ